MIFPVKNLVQTLSGWWTLQPGDIIFMVASDPQTSAFALGALRVHLAEDYKMIPDDCLVVTESGIHSTQDVARMRAHNVHAFLVGEAFMRVPDPGTGLRELFFN